MDMHRLPVSGDDDFDFVTVKVKRNEPVFVLRAQDIAAYDILLLWADFADNAGASKEKTTDALRIAEEFRKWPIKKVPD